MNGGTSLLPSSANGAEKGWSRTQQEQHKARARLLEEEPAGPMETMSQTASAEHQNPSQNLPFQSKDL